MKYDSSAFHLNVVFRNAARTLDLYSKQAIRAAGLTSTQFAVLNALYVHGKLSVNDLKDQIQATSGNMTVVINNMERENFISRATCTVDRRRTYVELTAFGKQQFEQALPQLKQRIEEIMTMYSEDEREQLITLLKKFKDYRG